MIRVEPVRHPARYTGSTDGNVLTFTVTLTDSNQTLGPFTITPFAVDELTSLTVGAVVSMTITARICVGGS